MRGLVVLALVLAFAAPAAAEHLTLEVRPAVGYRNGRPQRINVVTLGWTDVEVSTARAFLAMATAAAEDGIELWIRSGFRSHDEQAMFYQAYRQGWGNRAARPGHSNHQSGKALDLYLGEGTFAWLEANARRFGFKRTVRGEPWHWEYVKKPRVKRRAYRPPADRV
jgi:zinc D-Ala-D-Ala carboxypeptidase